MTYNKKLIRNLHIVVRWEWDSLSCGQDIEIETGIMYDMIIQTRMRIVSQSYHPYLVMDQE